MADPSDKNNNQRKEENGENGKDGKPTRPSTSGKAERDQRPPSLQQQQTEARPVVLLRRQDEPSMAAVVRALLLARQFLNQTSRRLLAVPLGQRVLVVADKALSCAIQALRWASVPPEDFPIAEGFVLPPKPVGLSLAEPISQLVEQIGSAIRSCAMMFSVRLPERQAMIDQLVSYRHELEGLQMVKGSRPGVQAAGRQRSTRVAGRRSSPVQQSRVATPSSEPTVQSTVPVEQPGDPTPSESSSSTSSSGSTTSITEEVVRYFSPPRFITGWYKEEEQKGDAKEEKRVKEEEREEIETQEGEQRPSMTEEA